jgi:hypothetical protein
MAFDIASGLSSVSSVAQTANSVLQTGAGVLRTAANLGSALNNLSNPNQLLSAIRSINLPLGGEAIGSIINAAAAFGGTDATNDWRARLSMPRGSFFDSSPILQPLTAAGGLIFPYTPTITISHAATYNEVSVTHQNYQYMAYQSSRANAIQITGEFNVEDSVQAKYWIAAVHFLRSVTKMFTGEGAFAGNPPPILNFSAYGDHVFRNVPCVVTSFSMTLPKDVQYISTTVAAGSSLGEISALASTLAGANIGAVSAAASVVAKAGSALNVISNVKDAITGGLAGGMGVPRDSHVPVKSDLTITLQPVYSKEAVRQFSLRNFVNGAYVSKGYI